MPLDNFGWRYSYQEIKKRVKKRSYFHNKDRYNIS